MFTSFTAPNNRVYLAQFPENFNQRVVMIFHGANGQAESLINNPFTNQFINMLLTAGFAVVLPSCRPTFGLTPFKPRWESENDNNPDIDFINYILDHDKTAYNRSVQKHKAIEKVFLIGGSSGSLMASRMVLTRTDIEGLILVNGGNADQVSLVKNTISFNDNFNIPWYHCPLLNITSAIDDLIPLAHKVVYSNKIQTALISGERYSSEGGTHNWDSWVQPYYNNMLGWLLR